MTKLKRKILITTIVLLGLFILAAPIVNYFLTKKVANTYSQIIDSKITTLRLLHSVIRFSTSRQKIVSDILISNDSIEIASLKREMDALSKKNDANFKELDEWYRDNKKTDLLEKSKKERQNYNQTFVAFFKLLSENKRTESFNYNKNVMQPSYNTYQELLDTLVLNNHMEAFELSSITGSDTESLRKIMFGIGFIPSIILLIPLGILIILLVADTQNIPQEY